MSSDEAVNAPSRRFLVEIRGVLQIDAMDQATALRALQEWIAATGAGAGAPAPPGVNVWWLRVEPERDGSPEWRRDT